MKWCEFIRLFLVEPKSRPPRASASTQIPPLYVHLHICHLHVSLGKARPRWCGDFSPKSRKNKLLQLRVAGGSKKAAVWCRLDAPFHIAVVILPQSPFREKNHPISMETCNSYHFQHCTYTNQLPISQQVIIPQQIWDPISWCLFGP